MITKRTAIFLDEAHRSEKKNFLMKNYISVLSETDFYLISLQLLRGI
jgi:hypothetical protein